MSSTMSERWTEERCEQVFGAVDEQVARIVQAYGRASSSQRAEGEQWYPLAHLLAARVDSELRVGAGIAAALSPQFAWPDEVAELESLAADPEREIDPNCGAYAANVRKANDIVDGYDPEMVLGGNKVKAFYALLLDPYDPFEVCVDSWAIRAALGRWMGDKDNKPVFQSKAVYERFQLAYRKAAAELGVLPNVVQAVVWIVVRAEGAKALGGHSNGRSK